MSKLDVITFFKNSNFDADIIELEDSATVIKAANALGVNTNEIAKTLAFFVNNKPILIVMSGDARIDNKKYKDYFGIKAKMIPSDELESIIGHPMGGVCPFGVKSDVSIYLDESLKSLKYVYPAAGSDNSTLKITPDVMQQLTDGKWIIVCEIK